MIGVLGGGAMKLVAALLVVVVVVVAAGGPVAAATARLSYAAYVGGLRMADAEVIVTVDDEGSVYRIETSLATTGLAEFLTGFRSEAVSQGRLAPVLRPGRHKVENRWRGEDRSVRLSYDAQGRLADSRVVPPPVEEGREPVAAEDAAGALDPITAALFLMLPASGADAAVPPRATMVFDGRRLYRLELDDIHPGKVVMPVYSGRTVQAKLRYTRLGGRSGQPFFSESHGEAEAEIVLAPPSKLGISTAVPLMVSAGTSGFGFMTLRLVQVKGGV